MNILKPNLPFECAILFSNIPTDYPYGHISPVAEGPSGFSLISYQNP